MNNNLPNRWLAANNAALDPTGSAAAARRALALNVGVEWSLQETRPSVYGPWQQALLQSWLSPGANTSFHLPFTDVELSSIDPDLRERSLQLIEHYIELTLAARPSHYTLHLGIGGPFSTAGHWGAQTGSVSEEAAVDSLRRLAELGRERGFTIALENLVHGLTANPVVYQRLVRTSGVSVTFDIGHARGSEWGRQGGDPWAYLKGLEDRVVCVHIYEEEDEGGHHVPPRAGSPVLGVLLPRLWHETAARAWVVELFTPAALEESLSLVRAWLPELASNGQPVGRATAPLKA